MNILREQFHETKIDKETIKGEFVSLYMEKRLKRNLKRISGERVVEEEIENTGKWKG